MAKKNKRTGSGGMVYSTDPDFRFEKEEELESTEPGDQLLYVSRDKKGRGGKVATIVENFHGHALELAQLAKTLKQKCGVGGAAKDGEIIIQGDFKEKVAGLLSDMGYKVKQKGG